MLAPPKTPFASASRNLKALESPSRAAFGHSSDDGLRSEGHNIRDRMNKDGDKDGKTVMHSSRRNGREEGEQWQNTRQRRGTYDELNPGKNVERDHDDERDGDRDGRTSQPRGAENHRWEEDRSGETPSGARRSGLGRAPNEPSWYRGDDRQGEKPEVTRNNTKTRDWRDKDVGRRGTEYEGNRGGRLERDPEWMDEPDLEDKKQAHTAEDFQRWKERMKANNAVSEDKKATMTEPPTHERSNSDAIPDISRKVSAPLVFDPTLDKFFGLWNEPGKISGEKAKAGGQEKPKQESGKPNPGKPSKFTGFFSPRPDPKPPNAEPTPQLAASDVPRDSSSEDKEGFQRILQMLGGGNNNLGAAMGMAPSNGEINDDKLELMAPRDVASQREAPLTKDPESPQIHSPRSRKSIGLENLLGAQTPADSTMPPSRDSEFLLHLMQQRGPVMNGINTDIEQPNFGNPTGSMQYNNRIPPSHHDPQTMSRVFPPGFQIDSVRNGPRPHDKLNPTLPMSQKALDKHHQSFQNPGQSSNPQRPPGFEQLPPEYTQNFYTQRVGTMAPPPGFQNPPRNSHQIPPHLLSNLNISNERGGPFGMRPMGSGAPQSMLPPGFVGVGGAPPGFSHLPLNQDDRMGPSGHGFFDGAMPRPPMDVYGDTGQFGIAGRGAQPGPYRRQE